MAAICHLDDARTPSLPACCPLLGACGTRCSGFGILRPAEPPHHRRYCISDDFDACPTFLAYMLRRSRPKCQDSRCRELAFK